MIILLIGFFLLATVGGIIIALIDGSWFFKRKRITRSKTIGSVFSNV